MRVDLVALEVGHHAAAHHHAEVGGQPLEPPGVLGGDHVGARELLRQPRRGVRDAADRGRGQDEDAASAGQGAGHGAITGQSSQASVELRRDRHGGPAQKDDGALAHRRRPASSRAPAAGSSRCSPATTVSSAGWPPWPSRRWPASCGCGTSAGRTSSCSTRPTTPRTPGRCCTTATSPATSPGGQADRRRPGRRPVHRQPEHGRAPRGREVDHRPRRALLRDDLVRLARLGGRRRHADGAGHHPARTPPHRIDPAGRARPACCSPSTACTSCCPGRRCSTSSWRSSCSARCPAWSPTGTGDVSGWPGWCRPATAPPSTTGARCAACSGGRGGWPPVSSSDWPVPPSGTR